MTKNRKLFEEIDERSDTIQASSIETSSIEQSSWLSIWLWTLLVSLISLILVGGWTRLTDSGLSNEDLFLAKKLIRIPSNPIFSSLNLAQSVLLISYQLNVCSLKKNAKASHNNVLISKANYEEMQAFASRLETELDKKNFFYPEGKKKRMKTRLRKLIYGLELNKEDVKIFHGVLKALIKKN